MKMDKINQHLFASNNILSSNRMCLWINANAPDNGQFQRWLRSQGKISWYQSEDLVTRNAHVQYESSYIYLKKMKPRKDLYTRNTHMKYQSSNTHCLKDISKVKETPRSRSQIMIRSERSYHREYSCEISKF